MKILRILSLILLSTLLYTGISQCETPSEKPGKEESKLIIIWSSADRDVALRMVFMYAYNSKLNGWWDTVELLVWGPSSKLLAEDQELKDYIRKMKDTGVIITACKACADSYGISDKLSELGIDVKYMGKPLTEMLKSGWITLTF